MVRGLMQEQPLVVTQILDYAARWHPNTEVVTRTVEGPVVVTTYAQIHKRSRLCSIALGKLGVRPGSFVATLAWNTARHMEAWYGIMGAGAICHTLNPRLSDKDLTFIAGDAKDEVLIADASMWPQLLRIVPSVPSLKAVILLTDRLNMPEPSGPGLSVPVLCFEELLAAALPDLPRFKWVAVDERDACGMCYTSGTTGNPKGVLYSHRSNFLHALVLVQSDSLPLSASSCCLMVVPMFHANSWGLAYAAPMVGAKLVLPGPWLDGASLHNLIETHGVTHSAGVPTVWLNLLAYMEEAGLRFTTMRFTGIGGAAAPRSMIEAFEFKYGVNVRHLWGMTELSPLGTMGGPSPAQLAANRTTVGAPPGATPEQEALVRTKIKQGRPHVLCDMRIIDDEGKVMPHDGHAVGHLQVRGQATVGRYFRADKPATDPEGWFATGDVASIDPQGSMCITDRSKDVIKSGGEWISSIEIENLAQGFPGVREAAVVAIPDERWGERPLLVLALKHGTEGGEEYKHAVLKYLETRLARFAIPDDIVFVEEIPHNATGKVSKLTMRDMFKNHKPPPKSRL